MELLYKYILLFAERYLNKLIPLIEEMELLFKYILLFAERYSNKRIPLIEEMELLFKYRFCSDVSFRSFPYSDIISI